MRMALLEHALLNTDPLGRTHSCIAAERTVALNEPTSEFPLWFPAFFVGLWLFVCAFLAELSRWPALARRFPGGECPEGTVLRGQVIGVGMVGENNVTYLIPTAAGLYIYAHFLFRFRRRPVLVPWSEIRYESTRRLL